MAVVAATAVCAPLLEHRSFASVGFKLHRGWWRDFLLGCATGGAAIALSVGIIKLGGAVAFERASHAEAPMRRPDIQAAHLTHLLSWADHERKLAVRANADTPEDARRARAFGAQGIGLCRTEHMFFGEERLPIMRSMILAGAVAALFFLVAAAFEELLFRGFVFQALEHNIGPITALALTSVPFGIAHLGNPSATVFSTINTVLAGLWLGAAYLATRSLWLTTGLHFSWNFVMAICFGLPVSGLVTVDRLAMVNGRSGSPEWLSGGSYGPEGGFAATMVLMVATAWIWRSRIFLPSDEMLDSLKHGGRDRESLSARRGGALE